MNKTLPLVVFLRVEKEIGERYKNVGIGCRMATDEGFVVGTVTPDLHTVFVQVANYVGRSLGFPLLEASFAGNLAACWALGAAIEVPHMLGQGESDLDFQMEILRALGIEVETRVERVATSYGPAFVVHCRPAAPIPPLTEKMVERVLWVMAEKADELAEGVMEECITLFACLYMEGLPLGRCLAYAKELELDSPEVPLGQQG